MGLNPKDRIDLMATKNESSVSNLKKNVVNGINVDLMVANENSFTN